MSKEDRTVYRPKCTACGKDSSHGTGLCRPCRTTFCTCCRIQFDPKVIGAKVCTPCETLARKLRLKGISNPYSEIKRRYEEMEMQ